MKLVPLSTAAQIIMGQSPPSDTYNRVGDGLPFFQGKTDFGDLYPTARMYCNAPKKVAEEGDILISVRAPVGPTNISPSKSCIGRGLAAIRARKGTNLKYLLYFLRFYEPKLAEASRGSTFDAIGKEDLIGVQLPLPLLPEQERIAAILDKADRLRRLRRYALQLGDSYLQSVFLEVFGDPVTNPMGWEVRQLKDVVAKNKIITYGIVQAGPYVEDGVPYIRTGDIKNGRIVTEGLLRTSKEIAQSYKRSEVSSGDLVMSIRATVGTIAVVPQQLNGANLTQGTARISPGPGVKREFLITAIRSKGVQDWFEQNMKGATFREITLGKLRETPMIVPPMDKQRQFVQIVQRHERLRLQQRESLRQAEHLFEALLHQAFEREGSVNSQP